MVRRCSSHEKRDSAQVKAKDDGELKLASTTFSNIQKVTLEIVFNLRYTEDEPPTAKPYTHLRQPHPQHQSHL